MFMSGRDQRRALFSLKQIFQDDKDLVHEFVQNEGLEVSILKLMMVHLKRCALQCLVRLGRECDQTHQNHILRGEWRQRFDLAHETRVFSAIGQLMLYVDGMNGIIAHPPTICWLYELLDSLVSRRVCGRRAKFRSLINRRRRLLTHHCAHFVSFFCRAFFMLARCCSFFFSISQKQIFFV